jgi:RNA polymerase sigma-70 factor (ECF subfamily)
MSSDTAETRQLLSQAAAGDMQALGELFGRHSDRLRRLVQVRLDRRLQGRVDPSDVVQETYLELARALPQYVRNPPMPFFLWLRCLTGRKLQVLHRRHLGSQMRAAHREISMAGGTLPRADSESLAAQLLGDLTTPSHAAMRAELQRQVQAALNALEPLDREVLALRHYEQLSNAEIAVVLDLSAAAASNRYVRALKRLKRFMAGWPE